jgi:hypothetical protein
MPLQFSFSLTRRLGIGWFALGVILAGMALCLGKTARATILDTAIHDATILSEEIFDDSLLDDTVLDEPALLSTSDAIERIEIGNSERDAVPPKFAFVGLLPSDEILRRDNSGCRNAALRHSKSRTLRAAKNDLPVGQRRFWLANLGARIALFSRPSLQILFCCWLV